jgi:hypothetical protein
MKIDVICRSSERARLGRSGSGIQRTPGSENSAVLLGGCCARDGRAPFSSCAGILLLEFMIYVGAFSLVLSVAATAFYQFQMQSLHLRRNAHDIERVLRAGELWRAEVRKSATAEMVPIEGGELLRLDYTTNEILYAFQNARVWRKAAPEKPWMPFLNEVQTSVMTIKRRTSLPVCSWELELKTAQKTVRQKPLFSFLAVPGLRGT